MREALAWFKGECGGVDGTARRPAKPRQLVSQLEMRVMFRRTNWQTPYDIVVDRAVVVHHGCRIVFVGSRAAFIAPMSSGVCCSAATCRKRAHCVVSISTSRSTCSWSRWRAATRWARRRRLSLASFPPVGQQLVDAHNKRAVLLGGVAPVVAR
jgi:hypothetical protein